jgi:hypothetical protein
MAGAPTAAGEITVGMPGIVAAVIFVVAFIIDASHTPQPTTLFLLASVSGRRVLVVEDVGCQCRSAPGTLRSWTSAGRSSDIPLFLHHCRAGKAACRPA